MGTCLFSLRFHEVLKALTDCDEGKLHILRVLYEFWKNHPEVGHILCFIVLLHVIHGICGSSCCQRTLLDDLSVGGQVYSDPDRGLCGRGQLGVLS